MTPLEQRLLDYLRDLTGEVPALANVPPRQVAALPLFLRHDYQFRTITLFGHPWILALAIESSTHRTTQEYAQEVELIAAGLGLGPQVIIVLPNLPSWTRNRLVRARVPFIVPGNQCFLPSFTVDLRERSPLAKIASDRPLTPAAQAVVLQHILKDSLNDLPLRGIAARVGYSAMMITKVKDELESASLCETRRQGRSLVLRFPPSKRTLWEKAGPKLSSPVKKVHWLNWDQPGYPALMAGLTALSRQTSISEDRLPTYALPSTTFQANSGKGLYRACLGPEEANVRMESWSYNPLLLGTDAMVDPLSLYLSLRDSPDERIQQQLEILINQILW